MSDTHAGIEVLLPNTDDLNTAAEILTAFGRCNQQPDQEILLFLSLAKRSHPPIDALIELLRNVKLEVVLALAIQALSDVDAIQKDKLKASEELLALLSDFVKSHSSYLVRWAAADTILDLDFEFFLISKYLTEAPKSTLNNIFGTQVKRLENFQLRESQDYRSFLDFWIYIAFKPVNLRHFKGGTLHYSEQSSAENLALVISNVFKKLRFYGVYLQNLQARTAEMKSCVELDEQEMFIVQCYENSLFEDAVQGFSENILSLDEWKGFLRDNSCILEMLIDNQFYCLQSNSEIVRRKAARFINSLGNSCQLASTYLQEKFSDFPVLEIAVEIMQNDFSSTQASNVKPDFVEKVFSSRKQNSSSIKFSYTQLSEFSEKLIFLSQTLVRKKVRQDCQNLHDLLNEQKTQLKARFDARVEASNSLRAKIDDRISRTKEISEELYRELVTKAQFNAQIWLSIEEHEAVYHNLLDQYDCELKNEFLSLRKEAEQFFNLREFKSKQYWQEQINEAECCQENAEIVDTIGILLGASISVIGLVTLIKSITGWPWSGVIILGIFTAPILAIPGALIFGPLVLLLPVSDANKFKERVEQRKSKLDNERRIIINQRDRTSSLLKLD